MAKWGRSLVFELCLLVLFLGISHAETGDEYLQEIQGKLQILSEQFSTVYDLTPCDQSCGCSHDLCRFAPPRTSSCLDVNSPVYNCSCKKLKLLQQDSSITFVRKTADDNVFEGIQLDTVCRTQPLEKTFLEIAKGPFYTEFYVGTVDGTRRNFPGREEGGNCYKYDSRTRPWYRGGISHPNHLIVILDCGLSMADLTEAGQPNATTKLHLAKTYAEQLLQTLYHEDYIDVLAFGSDTPDTFNGSTQYSLDGDDAELVQLRGKIAALIAGAANSTVAQLEAVLRTAAAAFNSTPDGANRAKNMILFTDESWFDSADLESLASLRGLFENVGIFIYSIEPNSPVSLTLLADGVQGHYASVDVLADPLYELRSYFGYMATLHSNLYQNASFLSRTYDDFFGVGPVATISRPAFTGKGEFLGVAGIDVILSELNGTLNASFLEALTKVEEFQRGNRSTASGLRVFPIPPLLEHNCTWENPSVCTNLFPVNTEILSQCCTSCLCGGMDADPENCVTQ